MGYTNYFEYEKTTQKKWAKIVRDCKIVYNALPKNLKIVNGLGEKDSKPIFDNNTIMFNGEGDLSHETFTLLKDGSNGFDFCKTEQKPYDFFVQACLLVYFYHSPTTTIEITSDGKKADWLEAYSFIVETLKAKSKYKLNKYKIKLLK